MRSHPHKHMLLRASFERNGEAVQFHLAIANGFHQQAREWPARLYPSGLRFLRRFRLTGTVEGDGLANERLEGGSVDDFSF